MAAIMTGEAKDGKEAIEINEDGKLIFRVFRLIPHMTKPDRVTILNWHINTGDIVHSDDLIVTFEFLGNDWYISMPPLEPLRVLNIVVDEGSTVHLHDPLIIFEPVQSVASS